MARTRTPSTGWENRLEARVHLVPPDQLLANPLNARRHPGAQRDALRALLDEVGWVLPTVVNTTTGNLLDGHARVEEALSKGAEAVPVVYVAVSVEQEAKILLGLDPVGAMATYDPEVLGLLTDNLVELTGPLAALRDDLVEMWPALPPLGSGGGDGHDVGNVMFGKTPNERAAAYQAQGLHSIVLVYGPEYDEVVSLLASHRQRLGVESNAAVVLDLARNTPVAKRAPARARKAAK